jgi:hypothetical protein
MPLFLENLVYYRGLILAVPVPVTKTFALAVEYRYIKLSGTVFIPILYK